MKRAMIFIAALAVAAAAITAALGAAGGNAGTAGDPLVTLSYLSGSLRKGIYDEAAKKIDDTLAKKLAAGGTDTSVYAGLADKAAARLGNGRPVAAVADMIYNYTNASSPVSGSAMFRRVTTYAGDVISGSPGTRVIVFSGAADIGSRELIDVTNGVPAMPGGAMKTNVCYMLTEKKDCAVNVRSDGMVAYISGGYGISRRNGAYLAQNADIAAALKKMHLFSGSGASGFNLSSIASRAEGMVMLVRLLGQESTAASGAEVSPFADLPEWAKPYVNHAYAGGLTAGVSATQFNPNGTLTADQYIAFLLRALGYNDSAGDFAWNTATDKSVELGIFSANEAQMLKTGPFFRDKMVYASFYALSAKMKGSDELLIYKLIDSGVVDEAVAVAALSTIVRPER